MTAAWIIARLLAALAALGVALARARAERDEGRRATAAALTLVRQAWPPLHLLTTSPREEDRRAGVMLQQLFEDLEDCLRRHAPPAVAEGRGSAGSDLPPEQRERQGVQTQREPGGTGAHEVGRG